MKNAQTTLLGIDAEQIRRCFEHPRRNWREPAIFGVEIPDSTVDVAWVHAVNGNVSILIVQQHPALQLREPDLEKQFVVLVVSDAVRSRESQLAIEICKVELAQKMKARSRT